MDNAIYKDIARKAEFNNNDEKYSLNWKDWLYDLNVNFTSEKYVHSWTLSNRVQQIKGKTSKVSILNRI